MSTTHFHRLIEYIEQFSQTDQEKEFREGTMNRRIRGVLCYLHHWHLLMLDWYREGMNGNKPSMPAEGYTWKTTPALNLWIFESYQDTSLEESKYLVKKGFYNLQKLIVSHSNEELFTKKTLLLDGNNLAWILSNFCHIEPL